MQDPELTAAEQEACEEALKRIAECTRRRSTVLDLSGLKLTRLPAKIGQLGKLTELNLSHNLLAALPPELGQLPNLTRLDLSHTPLAELPPVIGQLANLAVLDVSNTPLATLPLELGQLANLTRLELSHTRLTALPPELGRLAKLTRLYLSHTPLAALPPEVGQLGGLTRMYLSHNRLATLPPELGRLANLTRLDLSHNRLEVLPPELGQLAKLTVLDLSHNRLAALPPELGQLAKLTVLSLTANRLAALPEPLRELEHLESLFLHDNPDLQLLPSVLGADPRVTGEPPTGPLSSASAKSILGFYFARLLGETRPLNEVKLLLLGRSGVGKTSLMQALRDLAVRDREDSTPGVGLSEWTLDSGKDEPVTVHGWDFSGQELTHALHPFFFSRRSLYVVVLAGRDHREQDDADYWLRLIETHAVDEQGQGPPVIVALNQWNVPGQRPEVDRGALRERYPFIRGFVEMDCKVKKGVAILKAALSRELERMPWVREPFPEEWHAVRRTLAADQPHLTEDDYRARCVDQSVIDQGQQDYLAEILHQLGTALNYRHDPRLAEAAVWQPEWLTKHLYAMLHRAEKQAGLLTSAEVALVLYDEPDPTLHAHLMRFMERCGLARPWQSKTGEGWLVPQTLPTAPAPNLEDFITAAGASRQRWLYQEIPEGIVARVSERRFDHIEEQREQKQLWRGGVILARKGARALIQELPHERQVQLTVIGPRQLRLQLADLCREELREIHATFPGLEAAEEFRRKGEWVAVTDAR
jgi:Leucine-rich repeat (LRR) protein